MADDVSIRLNLYDLVSKGVTNIQDKIGNLNATIAKTQAYFDSLGQRTFVWNQIGQAAENASRQIQNISGPGKEFQQQMADLKAITGIAGKDLENLSESSRIMGIKSGLGASQAAEAFKLLASNIDVTTIGGVEGLKKLHKETITLAKASGVDLPTAADTMSFAINQFGLKAEDAARVINTLGAGAKFGAAEIPDLAASLKMAGTTAAQSGISIEGAVGAIEVLSQNAIKGSEAGVGLRNVMLKMRTALGVDFTKTSLPQALEALKPKLKDVEYLTKIFGLENVNAAQILIANAGAVQQMTDKVTNTNVAYEQAKIRSETYAETLKRVRAFMDDIKISAFNVTGAFLPATEVLAGFVSNVAQIAPGLMVMKDGLFWVTNKQNLHTIATKLSSAATSIWAGITATATAVINFFTVGLWKGIAAGWNWLRSLTLQSVWLGIVTVATAAWTIAQNALNAAFLKSPIGWIVLGFGILVTAIVLAWKKFEGFRNAVLGVWTVLKSFGTIIKEFIVDRIKGLINGISGLGKTILLLFQGKWKEAWQQGKQAVIEIVGIKSAQKLASDISSTYKAGSKANADREYFAREFGKVNKNNPNVAGTQPGDSFVPNYPDSGGGLITSDTNAVTGGGQRNITINLKNLIEQLTISPATVRDGVNDMERQVQEALLRVLNSANIAAYGR